MEEKKISILMNNYNYDAYIGEAIESVLSQTYHNWELIIVDDGSADHSVECIKRYERRFPDRIQLVLKANGGQASAFNAGYSKIKDGGIVAFLDSDDYWFPDKLKVISEIHGDHEFVGHKNHYSEGDTPPQVLILQEERSRLLKQYGCTGTYALTTSSISFRRRLLDKIMPVPERLRICADHYLKLFGLYYSNIAYLPEEYTYYRIHGKNGYVGNLSRQEGYLDTLTTETVTLINERLRRRGEEPIPFQSTQRLKAMCEKEENFIIENKGRYVLYGTGAASDKVKEYIEFCGGSVVGYTDSKEVYWGKRKENLPIDSPEQVRKRRETFDKLVIASSWVKEIGSRLDQTGWERNRDYIYSELMFI